MSRLDLPVEGMTCSSCAGRIEKSLNELDGVEATVNFATERATVEFDPGRVEPEQLLGAVEKVGYTASIPSDEPLGGEPAEADPTADLRRRLIFAAALSLPVLLLAMIEPLQFENWQWLSLQLATPVVLWAGWPFHQAAWQNLRHGAATMDTLVSLGVLAAWGWSLYALFIGDAGMTGMTMSFELLPTAGDGTSHLYLEVGAAVTVFLLAGRYFEARAK
ncbi:MAG TPA: cation transporter, partial [Solirubrobacterales bacterium]